MYIHYRNVLFLDILDNFENVMYTKIHKKRQLSKLFFHFFSL